MLLLAPPARLLRLALPPPPPAADAAAAAACHLLPMLLLDMLRNKLMRPKLLLSTASLPWLLLSLPPSLMPLHSSHRMRRASASCPSVPAPSASV